MNVSTLLSIVCVSFLGVAACGETMAENKERTAACTDRTNGVSCMSCCGTKESSYATKVCICKGELLPPK